MADLWAQPGSADVVSVSHAATAAAVHVLAEAGCLVEPTPAKPSLTVEEAARMLCELSRHVRLNPPGEEYHQLLDSDAMVSFAWTQATAAGIPPSQLSGAHEARRVLLAHHRGTDAAQS